MHCRPFTTFAALAIGTTSALAEPAGYEVWASDQSNSVPGQAGVGTKGSFLWIWDSADIEAQLAGGPDAVPLACDRSDGGNAPTNAGPCDLLEVFPQDLAELNADGTPTGNTLADLAGFGRLHGMIADPQGRYVNANIFAPTGGYIGVIDTRTKAAVALFRVPQSNAGRSVHMSFWSSDGSAILIANLNGKLLDRIDVTRNGAGKITGLALNRSATLGVGKGMAIVDQPTVFVGKNAHGDMMIGEITGSYAQADLGDLTPFGNCRENGCTSGPDAPSGGRPNNVIICPITSSSGNAYITMGGGGLLVADLTATPMTIRGEYGNHEINGAGCGGVQVGDSVYLNAGVSASGAGATQSTFSIWTLDDAQLAAGPNPPDTPLAVPVFVDSATNTATGGSQTGEPSNLTGQLPGITSRRDSHGMVATVDGRYVHTVDRIGNVVEVIDTATYQRSTYDLSSADGQGTGTGGCAARSVSDDPGLPINDAAPDLMDRTPDGAYLVIALRGPAPVSVQHSAQGSCPGVGIVALGEGGRTGALVDVLRTTNVVDTAPANAPGGHPYAGSERSDVHGAIVVPRR